MRDKIFPFLWHHGESNEVILREIEKIYECGLRSFCVESRPHPDFCGDGWWKDFGFILDEAKKRGMTVWLLDEKHYPSGYANDGMKVRPDLKQVNAFCCFTDVAGVRKNAKILLCDNDIAVRKLVCVIAAPVIDGKARLSQGVILTDNAANDILYWDIPDGHYRIFAIYSSTETAAWNNVNTLNPASTDLVLERVYNPHYEHFKEYFGTTFVGFFSDEPRFGNGVRGGGPVLWTDVRLGTQNATYPWSDGVKDELSLIGLNLLPSLWFNFEDKEAAAFRVRYMNYITDEYSRNYSQKLGAWCKERGVMYSGHIIEDNGAHARTTCSAGHYFKAMKGQTISGVDVVYNQIETDLIDEGHYAYCAPHLCDYVFYDFQLAKLASSSAHLDKEKQGRALCEIFGAFGWGESISKMKYLIDFMVVRGINHFIPHAFDPKIDDEDSPPYFYCGGLNPQYESFKTLMGYTLKLCDIYNGGKTDIRVAVLYHAEAEWCGGKYYNSQYVCRYLMQRQVDFDIVPRDEIKEVSDVIKTENCTYDLLIIPYGEAPDKAFDDMIANKSCCVTVKDESDLDKIDLTACSSYRLKNFDKNVRVYKYIKPDATYYFVTNESGKCLNNVLLIDETGYYTITDEAGFCLSGKSDGGIPLSLASHEAVSIRVSTEKVNQSSYIITGEETVCATFKYYTAKANSDEWTFYKETTDLIDMGDKNEIPDFCGKVKISFLIDVRPCEKCALYLGDNTNGMRVFVNGKDFGERIGSPYVYDISKALTDGKANIDVVIASTMGLKKLDILSRGAPIGKIGLEAYPRLIYVKNNG